MGIRGFGSDNFSGVLPEVFKALEESAYGHAHSYGADSYTEKAVADFKAGKNVTGFLVGQCMKASKGQGNPQIINKLIASELAKL